MTEQLSRRHISVDRAGNRVQIFAKAPIPGLAKTRLAPAIGASAAAELHARLVRRTLTTVVSADVAGVELWCSPSVDHPFFTDCHHRFRVALHAQPTGDLGARIGAGLADGLARSPRVVVIGTDCPTLTAADLHDAFAVLAAGADAVLGPAADGGYYLIGMRRVEAHLFSGIDWGGPEVLAQTRARLVALDWTWHELTTRWDVDRPEDVARLDALPSGDQAMADITRDRGCGGSAVTPSQCGGEECSIHVGWPWSACFSPVARREHHPSSIPVIPR